MRARALCILLLASLLLTVMCVIENTQLVRICLFWYFNFTSRFSTLPFYLKPQKHFHIFLHTTIKIYSTQRLINLGSNTTTHLSFWITVSISEPFLSTVMIAFISVISCTTFCNAMSRYCWLHNYTYTSPC